MLRTICIFTKLPNGILTVASLKASTISFSGFCSNICSGFTDFYFVFEDLFVEREASDINTIVAILQSVLGRFR